MMLGSGALAPHFVLLGIDGREYALPRDTADELLLLVFFKSTCETCDLTFPYLKRLRDAYPAGWNLWAVAQDRPDAAAAYAARHAIDYPVLVDAPDYSVSLLYDPEATPSLFLADASGRLVHATHGFAKDDLNGLARLIAANIGVVPAIVAPADDGRPSFRPG